MLALLLSMARADGPSDLHRVFGEQAAQAPMALVVEPEFEYHAPVYITESGVRLSYLEVTVTQSLKNAGEFVGKSILVPSEYATSRAPTLFWASSLEPTSEGQLVLSLFSLPSTCADWPELPPSLIATHSGFKTPSSVGPIDGFDSKGCPRLSPLSVRTVQLTGDQTDLTPELAELLGSYQAVGVTELSLPERVPTGSAPTWEDLVRLARGAP